MQEQNDDVTFLYRLYLFITLYWRSIVAFIAFLIYIPHICFDDTNASKCVYCILLMMVLWIVEALPHAITSLLPFIMFPICGIMSSKEVAYSFMKCASLTFLGCVMITIAVMETNLLSRITLIIISAWGYSHKSLCLGFGVTSMILTMFIPNPMVIMIMLPIIKDFLVILHTEGISEIYEPSSIAKVRDIIETQDEENDEMDSQESFRVPSNIAICYYLTVAYASSIGSLVNFMGSPGGMAFKGLFEETFPFAPTVEYPYFLAHNIFPMIIIEALVYEFFLIYYFGQFRPKSTDAITSEMLEHEKIALKEVVATRYKSLGPVSYPEMATGFILLLEVLFLEFRKPFHHSGWAGLFDRPVQNSTPAMFLVILLFIMPKNLDFLDYFNLKLSKSSLPQTNSPGLLQWSTIHDQLPWGFIYVLGAGFAICAAIKKTNASIIIQSIFSWCDKFHESIILLCVILLTKALSEVCLNLISINLLVPVFAEIARKSQINPLKIMLATSMGAAITFHFPIGNPVNMIMASYSNIPPLKMAIAGIGPSIIAVIVCWVSLLWWTPFIIPSTSVYPFWANNTSNFKSMLGPQS